MIRSSRYKEILASTFRQAFDRLNVFVDSSRIDRLVLLVYQAMTAKARHYHTLEHVFTFIEPSDPIRSLAALYHDLVYYQVDLGFSPSIKEIVDPYYRKDGDKFFIAENFPPDRLVSLVMDVFDLRPGQRISSMAEVNEFFSALVLVLELGDLLTERHLLPMIVCIESTIPFRGAGHFINLESRMREIAGKYFIPYSEAEIYEYIRLAVMFSNKDIESFAESDPAKFLVYTWKLLPESNISLRSRKVFTIKMYRQALHQMEKFLVGLEPGYVFNRYRGVPTETVYRRMIHFARNNIETAREYLRIKLTAVSILEAIAEETGGDAPLSMFMGDLPKDGKPTRRMEQFFPQIDPSPWVNKSSVMYRLLNSGRARESGFDMRNSPLSLLIYQSLSPEEITHTLDRAKEMYTGTLSPMEILSQLDTRLVKTIARASALMVPERSDELKKLMEEIDNND